MSHSICKNPACQKTYEIDDVKQDDGFCSDECWEAVNCHEPEHIRFEEIHLGV